MTTATARRLIPIDEVSDLLAGRIQALAAELLPNGRRAGSEWYCGSLAGEPGTQMAVHLTGAKAGVWKDFRADVAGDALDLVAQVLFRGDKKQALHWSMRWLGIEQGDPAELATARRQAAARVARGEDEERASHAAAKRLWLSGTPEILGTPVELYLAGRGIDLSVLPRAPRALRFHPAVMNMETGRRLPAMLAGVTGPGGMMACHRTWLEQAGPGDWRKARVEKAKKVLGSYRGACISLWRGITDRPLPDAREGEVVDVTEGIEDGLTVATACPEARVIAAVSLSNLANLALPPAIGSLRLWRQRDTAPAAIAAFDRAVGVFLARGLKVLIPELPAGVKDVNEWLTKGA